MWMVGDEPEQQVEEAQMVGFRDTTTAGVALDAIGGTKYRMRMSASIDCGEPGDDKVKVWRWRFQFARSQMEWNGIAQTGYRDTVGGTLDRIWFFSNRNTNRYAAFKCFELVLFRGILTEVQRSNLLSYYFQKYNLPA
jgi:hypothetical protein